jgi:outer membrane protein
MRSWPRQVLAVAAATLLADAAAAQDVLSLERAIGDALAKSPAVRAARAGVDEAEARADAARGPLFPRLTFGESWQRGDQPVFVFSSLLSARQFTASNFAIDALNHPPATNLFHASVGVEQLLFDGGRAGASARAASLQANLATVERTEVERALVVDVTQSYGRVLTSQAAVAAARRAIDAAREDLAHSETRREAGTASDADVLALSMHVADMQQRAIQAEGDYAIACADLNRLSGAPLDRIFRAAEPPPPAPGALDVEALMQQAAAENGQVRRATTARDLSEQADRQARGALMPTIAGQAGVQADGLSFGDRSGAWIVGAQVQWTISSSGAEVAGRRAAAHGRARADAELEAARDAVRLDVLAAVRRLDTARARGALARTALDLARERDRVVRDRFEAGLATSADVTRAASALLDAEAQRVGALVDALVADATLKRAVGGDIH